MRKEMIKERKTYGVQGMMEYQAVVKVGRNRMKVSFTDGSVSAMGVNPATFSTESYMVQHAIENSEDFNRGLIYLVDKIELGGKVEIERGPDETAAAAGGTVKEETAAAAGGTEKEGPAASAGGTEKEETAAAAGGTVKERDGFIEVEFASNDEAKDYLEQNFGLVRSKLRNREDICKAGKANGVEIIFV